MIRRVNMGWSCIAKAKRWKGKRSAFVDNLFIFNVNSEVAPENLIIFPFCQIIPFYDTVLSQ